MCLVPPLLRVDAAELEGRALSSRQQPIQTTEGQELIVYPCAHSSLMGQDRIHQHERGGSVLFASARASCHVELHASRELQQHMPNSLDSNGTRLAKAAKERSGSLERERQVTSGSSTHCSPTEDLK